MKRRNFIQLSGLASASLFVPKFLQASPLYKIESFKGKILVVIQMSGGNDGLNAVVPFNQDAYYQLRPSLGLKGDELIKLNEEAALNSVMKGLADLFNEGHLSILNSVGYPNPNRSHFRSMDIWQSASSSDQTLQTGWLGRALDSACNNQCIQPYSAIELDDAISLALKGENQKGLAFRDLKTMSAVKGSSLLTSFYQNYQTLDDHEQVDYLCKTLVDTYNSADYLIQKSKIWQSKIIYPQNEFANKLKTIAKLINAESQTMIYYVSISGFDSHALQKQFQTKQLKALSDSLKSFVVDLKSGNKFNDTLIMCFSEFGRRVQQNASGGTDHGTANNVYLIGGALKEKGLLNNMANLSDLEDGDLKYQIDFRQIYSTILQNWLNVSPSNVWDSDFSNLSFI